LPATVHDDGVFMTGTGHAGGGRDKRSSGSHGGSRGLKETGNRALKDTRGRPVGREGLDFPGSRLAPAPTVRVRPPPGGDRARLPPRQRRWPATGETRGPPAPPGRPPAGWPGDPPRSRDPREASCGPPGWRAAGGRSAPDRSAPAPPARPCRRRCSSRRWPSARPPTPRPPPRPPPAAVAGAAGRAHAPGDKLADRQRLARSHEHLSPGRRGCSVQPRHDGLQRGRRDGSGVERCCHAEST